jgi:hypothetical protein
MTLTAEFAFGGVPIQYPVKTEYDVTGDPGLRAAWALGGKIEFIVSLGPRRRKLRFVMGEASETPKSSGCRRSSRSGS